MVRRLSRGVLVVPIVALLASHTGASVEPRASHPSILERFLSLDDPTPTQFRALRHLEAENGHFEKSAWMDVWTEGDASGFRYQIVSEDGSEYIRSHVFRTTLETERKMWASGAPDKAGFTHDNYVFEDRGSCPDGLVSLAVKPRRKDLLLVDGTLFLRPDDGELMRLEGELAKSPSFWTRRVQIVRHYQRFIGIRMPIALETVASVRIAGQSTFRMTYEYESINGQQVGTPQRRAAAHRVPAPQR
jgi:hypothetical protein